MFCCRAKGYGGWYAAAQTEIVRFEALDRFLRATHPVECQCNWAREWAIKTIFARFDQTTEAPRTRS